MQKYTLKSVYMPYIAICITLFIALYSVELFAEDANDDFSDELGVYDNIDYGTIDGDNDEYFNDPSHLEPAYQPYIAPQADTENPDVSKPNIVPKVATNTAKEDINPDDSTDDLAVYNEDVYKPPADGTQNLYDNVDNDAGYYYEPGKTYSAIDDSSDDLAVYNEDVYQQPDNPQSRTDLGTEAYIPYKNNGTNQYQLYGNEADADQIHNYYDTEPLPNDNTDYSPSQDFYPDYYDY